MGRPLLGSLMSKILREGLELLSQRSVAEPGGAAGPVVPTSSVSRIALGGNAIRLTDMRLDSEPVEQSLVRQCGPAEQ